MTDMARKARRFYSELKERRETKPKDEDGWVWRKRVMNDTHRRNRDHNGAIPFSGDQNHRWRWFNMDSWQSNMNRYTSQTPEIREELAFASGAYVVTESARACR